MLTRVFLLLALALSGLTVQPNAAHANDCGSAARQVVSGMAGATLLSVQARTGNNGRTVCVARIKLAAKNGNPPRVVVRRFAP